MNSCSAGFSLLASLISISLAGASMSGLGHPTAMRLISRHLEDQGQANEDYWNEEWGNDDANQANQYTTECEQSDDDSAAGMVCTVCMADGSYCVTEKCSFDMTDDNAASLFMTCDFCATRAENGNNDYSFCMTMTCDLSQASVTNANVEDYCGCDTATLNSKECSKCEFCSTDDIDYNPKAWNSQSGAGSISVGLDLQCPDLYLLEAEGDMLTCPAYKGAAAAKTFLLIMLGLSIAGAASAVYFYIFHKPRVDSKKEKLVDINEQEAGAAGTTNGVMT